MKPLDLAKLCHNMHNVYCKKLCQPVIPWEEKSNGHQLMVADVIRNIQSGKINTPEEAHQKFVEAKIKDGWVYGSTFSAKDKKNPRLRPFHELPLQERQKDRLFFSVVKTFI